MKPTSQTQPYRRKGARQVGPVLDAMQRGRTSQGANPADIKRATQRKKRRGKRKGIAAFVAKSSASGRTFPR